MQLTKGIPFVAVLFPLLALMHGEANPPQLGFARYLSDDKLDDKAPRRVSVVEPDPQGAVEGFFAALDRGDIRGMGAVFTDDGVLRGFGLCTVTACAGKRAIEHEIQRLVQEETATVGPLGPATVSGHTLTTWAALTSRTIQASGLERVVVQVSAEARRDKLSSLQFDPDPSDEQTASYLAWPPVIPVISATLVRNRPVFRVYVANRSPEPVQIDLRLFLDSGILQRTWAGAVDRNRGTLAKLADGGQEVGWVHPVVPGGRTWGPFVAEVITDRWSITGRAVVTFVAGSFSGQAVSEDLLVSH